MPFKVYTQIRRESQEMASFDNVCYREKDKWTEKEKDEKIYIKNTSTDNKCVKRQWRNMKTVKAKK